MFVRRLWIPDYLKSSLIQNTNDLQQFTTCPFIFIHQCAIGALAIRPDHATPFT
jgi:hypothetical protein